MQRLFTAALLAASLTFFAVGCGTDSDDLEAAKAKGAAEQRAKDQQLEQARKQLKLEREIAKLKRSQKKQARAAKPEVRSGSQSSGAASSQSSGASCGDPVSVGPNTSCAFAFNVASEYFSAGPGNQTIQVYSPVTGRTYTMNCVAGAPTVCRGGNNAVVYIR